MSTSSPFFNNAKGVAPDTPSTYAYPFNPESPYQIIFLMPVVFATVKLVIILENDISKKHLAPTKTVLEKDALETNGKLREALSGFNKIDEGGN